MNRLRGGIPVPEYRRTSRPADPALRGHVPALASPTENANQTLNKVALLLNRAGSSAQNPILSGLGQRWEWRIDDRDRLLNVYIYQRRPDFGPDRVDQTVPLGGSIFALDIVHGAHTTAGSPETGAIQNFYRVVTRAGAGERYAYVKSYDKDVVVLDGENALDDNLDPVEHVVQIVDDTRDWIEVPIAFMKSWADEFQVAHNRNVTDEGLGNRKAYGGASHVSFFQTEEDEGVGTEVNPVNQTDVATQHTLQVENTVGLKHVTVRFRSKEDSLYFVDVEILIRVVAPEEETCGPPSSQRCGEALLLAGTPLPANMPGEASVVGVPTVAGTEGEPLERKLMYFAIHANIVGGSPRLLVKRSYAVASAPNVSGMVFEDDEPVEYIPLVYPADMPEEDPPYTGPVQLIIALDYLNEKLDGVSMYTIMVKDGDLVGQGIPYPGPSLRDSSFFPLGETGGTNDCFYG